MLLATLLLCAAQTAPAATTQTPPAERQILWQRTLEDALELSRAEGRPILVAVNMDGESASERIVRERYRDPKFVALTRPFVCIMASAFRHTPRDHDDSGRRIPCPRLGEVTCGEHIALEPILFDRYLGGERIAPRHALIQLDGTKTFDLFQLFDLRDLDRDLAKAAASAPAVRPSIAIDASAARPPRDELERKSTFRSLAAKRTHRDRLALESFALEDSPSSAVDYLEALEQGGDRGASELLRVLFRKVPMAADASALAAKIADTAEHVGAAAECADALAEQLAGAGRFPGAAGLDREAVLLPELARLARAGKRTPRSLLLSYVALGSDAADQLSSERAQSLRAIETFLGPEAAKAVSSAIHDAGGPFDPAHCLAAARERVPLASSAVPAPVETRSDGELVAELETLEPELARTPDDRELQLRMGRASLALAQLRMAAGGSGVDLLLEDARSALERASGSQPADVALLLDRAHVAYLLSRFEDEETLAQQALDALPAGRGAAEDQRIETLRWLGDAAARLLLTRAQAEPAVEAAGMARGARALAAVALSREANDTDWLSLSSFFGALGRRREEIAFAQQGVERFPDSDALRAQLNRALEAAGRSDLGVAKAAWFAERDQRSATSAWYLGYALVVEAAELRRGEDPRGAITAYERAQSSFEKSRALKPDFADSVQHYLALCALGRGFAHLLADERAEAARALAEAIAIRPAIVGVRDALDREAIDLLDMSLEWRESGPSPVDALALLDSLEAADPKNAFWARSISDSELREALRADGRDEREAGMAYLEVALVAARRALAVSADDESRHVLAQAANVLAEHLLERGADPDRVRELLAEAAPLVGLEPPAKDAGPDALRELAAAARKAIGAARPIVRPGR